MIFYSADKPTWELSRIHCSLIKSKWDIPRHTNELLKMEDYSYKEKKKKGYRTQKLKCNSKLMIFVLKNIKGTMRLIIWWHLIVFLWNKTGEKIIILCDNWWDTW